jgi:hypothetical protein
MAKRSEKDPAMTSFHDHEIMLTPYMIINKLGEPDYTGDVDSKVQNEWICETEDGDVFTIYDWKEYREYNQYTPINWHIGGHSKEITEKALAELKQLFS